LTNFVFGVICVTKPIDACHRFRWLKLNKERKPLTQEGVTMDCKTAKEKIDFFFSGQEKMSQEQEQALNEVLYKHLTVGTTIRKHNVSCQSCWDYYQGKKRHYCGG